MLIKLHKNILSITFNTTNPKNSECKFTTRSI